MTDIEVGEHLYRFPGGLRLRHHKQVACRAPLERLPMPDALWIPLRQHQGPPGEPIVEAGETVLAGQPLTRAADDRQVPVHASTSGRIRGLVEGPAHWPPGTTAPCIVLEPDGHDRWIDAEDPPGRDEEADSLIRRLRAGGLAGLGGAMFPTAAKLRGDWPEIHTLILNGSECEPYISCDEMLMRERPGAILEGGRILARALGAREVVIGIEDQMGAVRRAFDAAAKEHDPDGICRVVQVTTIYPEGGEKQLIQVLTGREVPHDGLPQDLGLVCLNVATAAAARDIVVEDRPVVERIVTISGPGIAEPCNRIVRLGTPVRALIESAGGTSGDVDRVVVGGPMSGLPLASVDAPVVKGTNCILVLREQDVRRIQPVMPCINCGECVRVCPASLLPQQLFHALRSDRLEDAADLDLFDCIECGCCAHVCPSHIPLVDYYRSGKGLLRARGAEEARAARARARHEAREQREAQRAAERRRRREQRERGLESPDGARDEVRAAVERARRTARNDPEDDS